MIKPRIPKRLTVSMPSFKQIISVSPIWRESSKYFTNRYFLDLKCLKGGNMTLLNSHTDSANPLGDTVYLE